MSFDWLNVPGLNIEDTGNDSKLNGSEVPPSVSFDFGAPPPIMNNSVFNQDSRSVSDSALNMENDHIQRNTSLSNNNYLDVLTPQNAVSDNHLSTMHENQELSKYQETPDDLKVPLSLSQTQLTHEEVRTYLRWYKYILARSHTRLVRLQDVFRFLGNFKINEELKLRIVAIFRSCKSALNIGQFFAVLRLISKAMIAGILPTRRMILEKAPIPKPRSILSKQENSEIYEEIEDDEDTKNDKTRGGSSVDFDSFTSLLLTGKTTRKRFKRKILNASFRSKKVRFSESVTFQEPPKEKNAETNMNNMSNNESDIDDNNNFESAGPLDLSLPMDQLLKQMAKRKHENTALVSKLPSEQQETEEEKEELRDMQDSLSHFKQIQTVDAVADLGSALPPGFMNDTNNNYNNSAAISGTNDLPLEPLKPTATGSANYFMRQESNQNYDISQNNKSTNTLQPLKPTATGSANYLIRSHVEPSQTVVQTSNLTAFNQGSTNANMNISSVSSELQPLNSTATGASNHLMKQQFSDPVNALPTSNFVHDNSTINSTTSNSNTVQYQTTPQNDQFMNFPQPNMQVQQQQQQNKQPQHQQPIQTHQHHVQTPQPKPQYQSHTNQGTGMPQQNSYNNTPQSSVNSPIPLQPQNTYPETSIPSTSLNNSLQPQGSAPQSNLLFPGQNAASSYFQSLLSHTPSPNASSAQLPNVSNNSTHGATQGTQQIYNNTNNVNGYNGYQGVQESSYQQQQNQQTQQQQLYMNQMNAPQSVSYNNMNQQTNINQNSAQNNNNQNQLGISHYPFASQPSRSSQHQQSNPNILGDYSAIQNQVDTFQNTYNRR